MATFGPGDDLRGARFIGADLSGAVVRGSALHGVELDSILRVEQPLHPLGLAYEGAEDDGLDLSALTTTAPSFAEVLEARAGRVAMVRDHLAAVTPEVLAEPRRNPHSPSREQSVLACLHVILGEEWEHHRYAVRDLDALEKDRSDNG